MSDEVGALVFDFGSHSVRAGFAGEDNPKIPAFYLAKSAALTCFANGRHTGLVLDCGAIHTSAVPVFDGLVLTQEVVRSPLAGDFLVQQAQRLLDDMRIKPVPYYRIASKEPVNDREPARWKPRPNLPKVTQTYENFMVKNLIQDFVASVFQVSDDHYDQSQAEAFPMVSYEMPNGYNFELGHERFQIPEPLFDPSVLRSLYSNVLVVGGTSLITGFTDRLQRDLNNKTPPGTFQQKWISSHEYAEFGRFCVEKKCL